MGIGVSLFVSFRNYNVNPMEFMANVVYISKYFYGCDVNLIPLPYIVNETISP